MSVRMLKPIVLLSPDSFKNNSQVPLNRTEGLKQRDQISDDIIIYDVTEDVADEDNTMVDENPPVTPEANEDTTSDSSK